MTASKVPRSVLSVHKVYRVAICRLDNLTVNCHRNGALDSLQSNRKMILERIFVLGEDVDVARNGTSQFIFDLLANIRVTHLSPCRTLTNFLVDRRNAGLLGNLYIAGAHDGINRRSGSILAAGRRLIRSQSVRVSQKQVITRFIERNLGTRPKRSLSNARRVSRIDILRNQSSKRIEQIGVFENRRVCGPGNVGSQPIGNILRAGIGCQIVCFIFIIVVDGLNNGFLRRVINASCPLNIRNDLVSLASLSSTTSASKIW